jgi:hypothetical protein
MPVVAKAGGRMFGNEQESTSRLYLLSHGELLTQDSGLNLVPDRFPDGLGKR